jgi:PhnB protein
MAVKPIPDGYHSITPYLTVHGADRLIVFLKKAFQAKETERIERPDGTVAHAEVRIGDSVVMIGEAWGDHKHMPGAIYLYVDDVDLAYRRALEAGADSLMEPADQFYGDRNGGVMDPVGNRWWIATHVEEVSTDELRRRAQAAME